MSEFSQFAFVYLIHRFFFFVGNFVHHWYLDGTRFFISRGLRIASKFERRFAVWVTLHHLFEPLYQDYSIVGRIIGPLFRLGRVVVGVVLYIILVIPFLILYILWLSVPVALVVLTFISRP